MRAVVHESVVRARGRALIGELAPGTAIPGPGPGQEVPRLPTADQEHRPGRCVPRELVVIAWRRRLSVDQPPLGGVPLPCLRAALLARERDAAVSDQNVTVVIPGHARDDIRRRPAVVQELPGTAVPSPHLLDACRIELVDTVHEEQLPKGVGVDHLRVEARRRTTVRFSGLEAVGLADAAAAGLVLGDGGASLAVPAAHALRANARMARADDALTLSLSRQRRIGSAAS